MSKPSPALSSMRLAARPVRPGESLAQIAKKLFGDERLAALLGDLNPEFAGHNASLPKGSKLRIPSREDAQRWAASLGAQGAGLQAGHGTQAQRRWGAFAQKKTSAQGQAEDVVKLALSEDFAALVEQLGEQDTVGRGLKLWKEIDNLGEQSRDLGLGQQDQASLEAAIDKTLAREAISEAIDVHVLDSSARFAARIFRRSRQAILATLAKPERLARLLVGIARLQPQQAEGLLAAMAIPAALREDFLAAGPQLGTLRKALIEAASRPGSSSAQLQQQAQNLGLDPNDAEFVHLLRKLPNSAAARDRLLVLLAGLGPSQEAIAAKLGGLAGVMQKLEALFNDGVERSSQAPKVAQLMSHLQDFVPAMHAQLGVSEPESALARSLQNLMQTEVERRDPMIQLASALPAAMGPALLDTDAAALERGLAPVLKRLRKQGKAENAETLGQAINSVELLARAEAASAQASEHSGQVKEIGECAASLAIGDLPGSLGSSAAAQRKGQDRFDQLYSQPVSRRDDLDPRWFGDEIASYLGEDGALDPKLRRQARRLRQVIARSPDFIAQLIAQLPANLPALGARRLSPQGLALISAAHLLQADLAARQDPTALVQACGKWVGRAGGQALATCNKVLLGQKH